MPAHSHEKIVEIRDRLLAEAQVDYEFGYSVALDAAGALPLHAINDLANHNFDLGAWLKPYVDGRRYELVHGALPVSSAADLDAVIKKLKDAGDRRAAKQTPENARARQWMRQIAKNKEPWWWLDRTAEALGTMADPIGFDQFSFTPTQPRQRGYVDAMREVWSAVEDPSHSWADSLGEFKQLSNDVRRTQNDGGEADRMDDNEDDS